jgi:L-serine/L-threonine ammonia-lyase
LFLGWEDVPVVAMETFGAHSFNKSIKEGRVVENVLTSIAKTLGAPSVTPALMQYYLKFKVISEVFSDRDALSACFKFAG